MILKRIVITAAVVAIFATPITAESWISLGGDTNAEVDQSSFERRGGVPRARIRFGRMEPRGRITVTFLLGAMCGYDYLYIEDGEVTAAWSPVVAPMPDLPGEDRIIWITAGSGVFNTFYFYICNR